MSALPPATLAGEGRYASAGLWNAGFPVKYLGKLGNARVDILVCR